MSTTTRERVSIVREIRNFWPGAILGAILFVSGTVIIFWNEGQTVRVTKMLEEAISSVMVIDPSWNPAELKGKLLYLTGPLKVREPLTEPEYGVSVMAVKLKRRVQMYQWVEERSENLDPDGNIISNDYHYYKDWRDRLIDSTFFHDSILHRNPKLFPLQNLVQINEKAMIGNFELSNSVKQLFTDFVEVASDERPERRHIKLHAGLYYHSENVWYPEVGDIRIQFSYAGQHGMIITLVAMLDDNGALQPYTSPSGMTLLIIRSGSYTLEEVFMLQHGENHLHTWGYRLLAWFLMLLGCIFMGRVLWTVVMRVRILRIIFPLHLGSLTTTVSLCSSLVATALAWMWYRPELAGTLLLVSLAFVLCAKYFSQPTTPYQRVR